MIKYSIIVPCFNVDIYLDFFLKNIPTNRDDFELIFINDASTDGTKKILEKFIKKNKNFKLINHYKNKGIALTLKSGINLMQTNWFARLDPDDMVFSEYFDEIPKYTNDENSLIRYKFKKLDNQNNIKAPKLRWKIYYKASWGWSCLINFKATSKPHITRSMFAEDLFLFATTYRKNNLKHIFINKYLYAYRSERKNSISNTTSQEAINDLRIAYNFYRRNPDIEFTPRKYVQQVFIYWDIVYRQKVYNKWAKLNSKKG